MRKKEVSKLILQITEGTLSTLTDLLLVYLFYFLETTQHPMKLKKAEFLAMRDLEKFNYSSIKKTISRIKSKGWIKEDLTLTKEGKKRLEDLLPSYFGEKRWDGNWYMVSYDIPEKRKKAREILREILKKLGFGKLHASLWISPFNFLGEVERAIREYNLFSFVILAISNRVGREESKALANKIWGLEKINKAYRGLVEKAKKNSPKDLIFRYLVILGRDPQLPSDLLPEEWWGYKAHRIFKKLPPRPTKNE